MRILIVLVTVFGLGLVACATPLSLPPTSMPVTPTVAPVTTAPTVAPAASSPTTAPASGTATRPASTTVPGAKTNTPAAGGTTAPVTGAPGAAAAGKIVFDTSDGQVFTINPDGTGRTRVVAGRSPLWSPDGKRIAFLEPAGNVPNSPFPQVAIRSANLDGSGKQSYCSFDGNADILLLRWSPRNRYIAMNGAQGIPGQTFLCALDTNKLAEQKFKQGAVGMVWDWTPDGDNALWQIVEPKGPNLSPTLYYGDPTANGTGAVPLAQGQNSIQSMYYGSARFSPDGKTIAVAGSTVFFLSVPGQTSALNGKTLAGFANASRVAWSPDGRSLVVVDRANKTLRVVEIATGRATPLATDAGGSADWR